MVAVLVMTVPLATVAFTRTTIVSVAGPPTGTLFFENTTAPVPPTDGFAVAVSSDDGASWTPLLTFRQVCGMRRCG